ncbi:DUF2637 domain-containing protein [Amycolatopsis sp. SID8362]|uniref:DUF2637 domain-containing protein n=1 Tax=Amycolatopsis sp. SID8362 TaxID=2690346 RepID=UPI0035C8C2A3
MTASTWPLLVDGLLTIATVELWKTHRGGDGASRLVAWLAFVFGICLSLVANIGSVSALGMLQVTVAACPPLVLLLAVELLNGALKQRSRETGSGTVRTASETSGQAFEPGTDNETLRPIMVSPSSMEDSDRAAEQRMWEYYVRERSCGRTPTVAELDRMAGTHNYGRRILRKWRTEQDRQSNRPESAVAIGAATTSARSIVHTGSPS